MTTTDGVELGREPLDPDDLMRRAAAAHLLPRRRVTLGTDFMKTDLK